MKAEATGTTKNGFFGRLSCFKLTEPQGSRKDWQANGQVVEQVASSHAITSSVNVSSSIPDNNTSTSLQSSLRTLSTCSQGAYALTGQLTVGSWLQMLCTLLWGLALRQPTYIGTRMTAIASCVFVNFFIAVVANVSVVRLKSAAAAAWLVVASMAGTALRQLQLVHNTGSAFACSLTAHCSDGARAVFSNQPDVLPSDVSCLCCCCCCNDAVATCFIGKLPCTPEL